MWKVILLLAGSTLLMGAAGPITCQQMFVQDISAVEAKVAAFIAKVRAAAPIAYQDALVTADLACSLVPMAQQGVANLTSEVSNPSAKTSAALVSAAAFSRVAASACTAYQTTRSSGATGVSAVDTTVAVWNAYVAGKQQLAAAQNAVAAGK
jgi:hypothetical protein